MAGHPPNTSYDLGITRPVTRLSDAFTQFTHVQSTSGIVLLLASIGALILANSPLAGAFEEIWQLPMAVQLGSFTLSLTLRGVINDGLMAIFFFVIGLEVKRELVLGELRDPRRAALPIAAAAGGMIVPAAIYVALQAGQPAVHGWGIPVATDIAFVVGCLALLGDRVPPSLRIVLLSLAIADDIGAILVIAIGYTETLHPSWLSLCAAAVVVTLLFQRIGVRSKAIYVALCAAAWLALHEAGIHATIAGVIFGLITPAHGLVSTGKLGDLFERFSDFVRGDFSDDDRDGKLDVIRTVEFAARETISPLERLEAMLHPWVSFVIMPLFALANAGVAVDATVLAHGTTAAVALGLFIGKPIGIVAASFLAVRAGLARLPGELNWGVLAAGGVLCGIGFTMSLFIAELALTGTLLDAAKVGTLLGSAVSAIVGLLLLRAFLPAHRARTTNV